MGLGCAVEGRLVGAGIWVEVTYRVQLKGKNWR